MGAVRAVLVVASLALVSVASGAVGKPPVSGTLAYQLCQGQYCSRGWIEAWNLGQARARPLTLPLGRGEARLDAEPAWSPNGRLLAFVRVSSGRSGVYVVGAGGKGLRRIVALDRANAEAAAYLGLGWSPDGTRLVFDRYGAVECSGAKARRQRLTIARIDGSGVADVALLARPMTYRSVERVFGWSPDGTKLLYSIVESESDEENPGGCRFHGPEPSHLYTIGATGRGRHLLADADAEIDEAAWSPNSRRVAYGDCYYTEAHGGTVACDLALVQAGGGSRRTTLTTADWDGGIAWSPRGDEVTASLQEPPGCEDSSTDCTVKTLFAVNAGTGHRRRLGAEGEILGLSVDGRYVAVWRAPDLLLVPVAGGAPLDAGRVLIPKGVQAGDGDDLYLR